MGFLGSSSESPTEGRKPLQNIHGKLEGKGDGLKGSWWSLAWRSTTALTISLQRSALSPFGPEMFTAGTNILRNTLNSVIFSYHGQLAGLFPPLFASGLALACRMLSHHDQGRHRHVAASVFPRQAVLSLTLSRSARQTSIMCCGLCPPYHSTTDRNPFQTQPHFPRSQQPHRMPPSNNRPQTQHHPSAGEMESREGVFGFGVVDLA